MYTIISLRLFNIDTFYILYYLFLALLLIYFVISWTEKIYVKIKSKPFYIHFYPYTKRLTDSQEGVLQNQFLFYKRLGEADKKYFKHRVASFINDKEFIGRGIEITDEMKVLISATAVMLTFGFRDFYIAIISKIVVYPERYYSKINETYHKGEFNPVLKALVLSWSDFKEGYRIDDDNLNLGIHEITHAIHLNSLKARDVSSLIFKDSFKEITNLLSSNIELRKDLIRSEYFRGYAYTNQFEFLAVLIENFIETPEDFEKAFPQIFSMIKQMLNFNLD